MLVNNAGTVHARRTVTDDGIEATFQVNHLGGFLLTELLKTRLVCSAPARVVITSSVGHLRGTLDLDDVGFERGGYSVMNAYARSKLANVLYARSLAAELASSGVTVNAVHPGSVATDIWSGAPWFARPILALAKLRMLSPADGGRALTHLAVSPEVEGVTGEYFDRFTPRPPSDPRPGRRAGAAPAGRERPAGRDHRPVTDHRRSLAGLRGCRVVLLADRERTAESGHADQLPPVADAELRLQALLVERPELPRRQAHRLRLDRQVRDGLAEVVERELGVLQVAVLDEPVRQVEHQHRRGRRPRHLSCRRGDG